jgi:transposase
VKISNKYLDSPTISAIIDSMESTTITFSNPTEEINYLREQNRQLEALVETLQNTVLKQQHQIDGLIKRLYGRSSEKLDPNQLLMQELILEADQNTTQKIEDPLPVVITTTVAAHVRNHHGRQKLPEHLKRIEHVLDVKEDKKVCGCGKRLVHIGDDITERLDYQPSSLLVNSYVRPKYACGDSRCDGCGVKQHSTPEGPIERCEADSGLLAYVITEKYNHHTPLYRIEDKLEREGVNISRQTMADWMAGCAKTLSPLYNLMRDKILEYDIVGNDDTPVDMRDGPNKGIQTARMWATVGGENFKYTLYNFTTNRCKEGPLEFFKNYKGFFMSDAYAGYSGLGKPPTKEETTTHIVTHLACWAHARRYFKDAETTSPRAAAEVLLLIANLYHVETQAKLLRSQDRYALRLKESTVLLDKIKMKLEDHLPGHLPQSPMRQAINYTLGLWKELNAYLQDGRLPIDNNLAENAIRSIALGRKNWLFVGSEKGGHTAAVLMTIIATCHKNNINTWAYLKDVLQRIQSHPISRLEELLPDQWQKNR